MSEKIFNLQAIYSAVQKPRVNFEPYQNKQPCRFLANVGKQFADDITEDGYCTIEAALAYTSWLGLNHTQTMQVVKSPLLDDELYLFQRLDGLGHNERTAAFNSPDTAALARSLAPVQWSEVVDQLPYRQYIAILPLLPRTPEEANDVFRILHLKHFTMKFWKTHSLKKKAAEAAAQALECEQQDEAAYQAAIVAGEIVVPTHKIGLTLKECEAFEALHEALGEISLVPPAQRKDVTAVVVQRYGQYSRQLIEKRQKAKAEAAAQEAAKAYQQQREILSLTTPVLKRYGAKAVVTRVIEQFSRMSPERMQAYMRMNPTCEDVGLYQALSSLGDAATIAAIVDSDDWTAHYHDDGSTIEPICDWSSFSQFNRMVEDFDKEYAVNFKFFNGVLPPAEATFAEVVLACKPYSNINAYEVHGEIEVRLQLPSGGKCQAFTNAAEALVLVEQWIGEYHTQLTPAQAERVIPQNESEVI